MHQGVRAPYGSWLLVAQHLQSVHTLWASGPAPPEFENGVLSQGVFDSLVNNGTAFVLHGTAKDSGLNGWTCDSIRKDPVFRGAQAQLSYGRQDGSVSLSSDWESRVSPTTGSKRDTKAPKLGSLYFGIKDIQFADAHSPKSWKLGMLEKIQKLTRVPPYMDPQNLWRSNPDGVSELDSLQVSPELWLSPPTAGAQAHMDHHVSTTLSLQLSGQKQWRLMQIPARKTVTRNSEFGDGKVYRKSRWKPSYDFILEPGDALFFPPGTIHETMTIGTDCATSITYQFSVPMPARYYRNLLRRFRRSGDMQESWPLMQQWSNFLGRSKELFHGTDRVTLKKLLEMSGDPEFLQLRDAFSFLDKDGDEVVVAEDLIAVMDELRKAINGNQGRSEEL